LLNWKNWCIFAIILLIFLIAIIPQSFAGENITEEGISDDILNAPDMEKDLKGADYYFNSSSDSDGDGSKINPYNHLDDSRIAYSSTIHLANGEYNLSKDKSMNEITITGENPEKGQGSRIFVECKTPLRKDAHRIRLL
jgi:hypothetical protein